jgi:hypothetical protein
MSSEFEIEKRNESGNAYQISGVSLASGTPTDGQYLRYNATTNQWEYSPLLIAGIPVQAGTPANLQSLQYSAGTNEWIFV